MVQDKRETAEPLSLSTGSDGPEAEMVVDHLTGKPLPRKDAVEIRLGPGLKIWIPRECCRNP